MYVWVGRTLAQFFFLAIQVFGSLRVLGRPTPREKIILFSLLQTASIVLFTSILPVPELQFVFLSITHLLHFMWVFSADLFPDALFCYLTPLALTALGELIFPPFFLSYSPPAQNWFIFSILGRSLTISAYLPTLFLALFFVLKDLCGAKTCEENEKICNYGGWLTTFVIIPTICFLRAPRLGTTFPVQLTYLGIFFRTYVIALPVLGVTLYQYMTKERKAEKVLQYHQKRRVVQDAALRTLREERHDLLNELTLISTYVQMGRTDDALTSIAYSAAKLSDRYNYATLPTDAWMTVLELKQLEAKRRNIDFSVEIVANPPQSFTEQRLLPKVIMNLVDNAFAAVENQTDPKVRLTWSRGTLGERLLIVANNGPEINPWDGKMMFRGGVTSKKDPSGNHGWGLAICTQIARELGAALTYESSPEQTKFIFTLPVSSVDEQKHLPAN